jgi:hypothetical protein
MQQHLKETKDQVLSLPFLLINDLMLFSTRESLWIIVIAHGDDLGGVSQQIDKSLFFEERKML